MTATTTSRPLPAHVRVLVVGAGFGGLAMAIKLDEAGERDFLVVERGADVGGTWRDNTYPGAACDVPSQLYSYSFAPNPGWSRSFSPQPEIQAYIQKVAERSGTLDRFVFDTTVDDLTWDEADGRWRVRTTAGELTADVVVSAAGALSDPKNPDIPGFDDFQGEVFHSARWNHDYDLTGKRVAVIGTGASAIQIVPRSPDGSPTSMSTSAPLPGSSRATTATTPRSSGSPSDTCPPCSGSTGPPSTGDGSSTCLRSREHPGSPSRPGGWHWATSARASPTPSSAARSPPTSGSGASGS